MISPDSTSARLSVLLRPLADAIAGSLEDAAGEPIAFVLIVQADDVAQYVSNTKREDGKALVESLLERWRTAAEDVPAHLNPELGRKQ